MGHLQQMLFNEYTNENSELKCAICRKCLSVQPILHNSVYGNICGRWKCNSLGNSKGQNHEQQAYENVARYLIFPCMYRDNGCNAELKWSDVQLHEEACQFKKFFCPLSNNAFLKQGEKVCIWTGEISEFPNHVVESHSNRFFCESLVIDFQRNYTHEREIFFSKVLEDIILVIFHVNDSKSALFCKVWAGISILKIYNIK
ncbi:hypothetical protein HHI36_009322 [Cryptolaemus montrouzieri]|uniref:RING-type E3 ubiquitin transferase n=1 Tax=Cryptolaemus montrouzieri TaxID=559131 RepID=A0ABD2MV46_9CUCU